MFNSEKQFTARASKISFEETFMNVDTPDLSFNPSTGYRFGYPSDWLSNPSQRKMIGLRSLRVTPSSHIVELYLNVYDSDPVVDPESVWAYDVIWSITENNSLEEMLSNLVNIVKPVNTGTEQAPVIRNFKFSYSYDRTRGDLSMSVIETTVDNTYKRRFRFVDPNENTADPDPAKHTFPNTDSFLRFLNQSITTENRNKLLNIDELNVEDNAIPKTFTGVWNRTDLFFHASFSGSRRHLIGRNNDFWPTPSKKYDFRDSTNDFYVSFSSDGSYKIFPYYCNFYLELTFILNYDRSLN